MELSMEYTQLEQMLADRADSARLPFSGGFELTPYCNLSCKMCYVKDVRPGLSLLSGEQWLEIGRQAAQAGVFGVVLTGGEPLLHPDFKMIYSGLKKLGLILTINTNGTMIDEEMADFLAGDMPRRVNISLYGPDRACYGALCGLEDAFDRTIRAIDLLQARGVPIKINITPTTINFAYLPGILKICNQRGLHYKVTSYLFEPIRRSETQTQLYRISPQQMAALVGLTKRMQMDKESWIKSKMICYELLDRFQKTLPQEGLQPMQCHAGVSSFWICWDGAMNLCVAMTQPHADVLSQGFMAAWEKNKAAYEKIRIPVRCNTCPLILFCSPCAAVSQHDVGDSTKISPYMCQCAQEYARMMANGIERREQTESDNERTSV